ncbi:MAG: hypothetical protein PF436_01565 [Prolixibacteraceae bacterium]|jgi:hypothetical protein|nr:hypothetical protein [Prolixibacteraceae bacterium]
MTLQVGTAAMLTETSNDFSHIGNSMNHHPGLNINFQLGKMVWERVDIGFETGYTRLAGSNNNPSGLTYLTNHPRYNNDNLSFRPFPIQYQTDIIGFGLFTKYNFINFSTWSLGYLKINIYTRLGLGGFTYQTRLDYKNKDSYLFAGLEKPLYEKNNNEYSSNVLFYVIPSFGLNYQVSDRIFLSVEISTQHYNVGNLDGIPLFNRDLSHTMSSNEIKNHYIHTNSNTARVLIGATYFFNFNNLKKELMKDQPWFSNRYRTYYSKYQQRTSKKERQQWLPFYNEKFKND